MRSSLILFFSFISISLFPQNHKCIKGIVTDSLKNPIMYANIILKDSTASKIVAFAFSNKNGIYTLTIPENKGSFILFFSSLGYKKEQEVVQINSTIDTIERSIILEEESINLKEVTIKSKAFPIRVHNDTVTYKVEAYKDGTEEVIEDILKKLPGINVSESGKISYKGKEIDKLLIEGDDLFGKKYQIATKNLTADIIDKVQAIENYSENILLKGIENSNKTALNIKLKEDRKSPFALNGKFAYGNNNKYAVGINIISILKKTKSYIIGNANNTGFNPTPNNYLLYDDPSDSQNDVQSQALIGIDYLTPNIKEKRINFNKSKFGAFSFVNKTSDNLKIKGMGYFHANDFDRNRLNYTQYLLETGNIDIHESQSFNKKTLLGEGKLEIKYNLSKWSLLNYKGLIKKGRYNTGSMLNISDNRLSEKLDEDSDRMWHLLSYTHRFNDKNAIVIDAKYIKNKLPQNYEIKPGPDVDIIKDQFPSITSDYSTKQFSNNKNEKVSFNSKFLSVRKNAKYSLNLSYKYLNDHLNSDLFYFNNNEVINAGNDFRNRISYATNTYSVSGDYSYEFERLKIMTRLNFYFITSKYQDEINNESFNNNLSVLSPEIGFKLKISNAIAITSLYSFNKDLLEITDLYSGYILTNYRSFRRGLVERINIKSKHFLFINFMHSDWFNQFNFYLNFIYIKTNQSFVSDYTITDNYNLISKRVLGGKSNCFITSEVSKFIPFISSTIKLRADFTLSDYQNFVNSSTIRNNTILSSAYTISAKTALDKSFNFEIGGRFSYSKIKSSDNENIGKTNHVRAYLNFIIKPSKKWVINLQNEGLFFNVNEKNHNEYYFLDAEIKYILKKNKLSFKLTGRNLLNNKKFAVKYLTDYFINQTIYDLIPRHILLQVQYRF